MKDEHTYDKKMARNGRIYLLVCFIYDQSISKILREAVKDTKFLNFRVEKQFNLSKYSVSKIVLTFQDVQMNSSGNLKNVFLKLQKFFMVTKTIFERKYHFKL